MIDKLKHNRIIRSTYFILNSFKEFFRFNIIIAIKQYRWFFKTYIKFKKLNKNDKFKKVDFQPCLFDNISYTPLEPTYFFQDTWAAKKIFELKPKHHVDVGSSAKTIGIISQFTPTTFVDIRPINLELDNLFFERGTITNLPFRNNSIESISSLCVVEHIGLGRYGDRLDDFGSEKAVKELQRVVKDNGVILFSVPVDKENKIYFNAHRAFTRDYILFLFKNFKLLDEKYHYGSKLYNNYDIDKGFGTGLYMFKK